METTKKKITEHKEFAKLHKKVFTNTDIPDISYIESKRLEIAKFYSENEIASHILIKRYKQLCYDKQNFNAYFLSIFSGLAGGGLATLINQTPKTLLGEFFYIVAIVVYIPAIAWLYIQARKWLTKGMVDFLCEYEEKLIAKKLKKEHNFDVDLTGVKSDINSNKIKTKADSNKVKAKVKLHKLNSSGLK